MRANGALKQVTKAIKTYNASESTQRLVNKVSKLGSSRYWVLKQPTHTTNTPHSGSHVATDYECKATVKIKQIPGKQPAALAHTRTVFTASKWLARRLWLPAFRESVTRGAVSRWLGLMYTYPTPNTNPQATGYFYRARNYAKGHMHPHTAFNAARTEP